MLVLFDSTSSTIVLTISESVKTASSRYRHCLATGGVVAAAMASGVAVVAASIPMS